MADVKNVMGVSADDIKSIMGVAVDDIKSVVGLDWPASGLAWGGTRAVIFGGWHKLESTGQVTSDYILYKTLASDASTSAFGQMNTKRGQAKGSGSNITRALQAAGDVLVSPGTNTLGVEEIDYVTVGSTADATDFGNADTAAGHGGTDGASNGTLCFMNGGRAGSRNNDMEYITIASTGNGTDAGNLEAAQDQHATSNGNSKYLIMGGYVGSGYPLNTVSQHSFHTSNDATDYGQVGAHSFMGTGVVCSTTRVVAAAGYNGTDHWNRGDEIHYFTLDSGSNSTDDGYVLHAAMSEVSGTSDGTRGEFYGGHTGSVVQNEIQKVTIASLGNAADVGDLTNTDSASGTSYTDAGGVASASCQTGT